jgi:hypothetical protein
MIHIQRQANQSKKQMTLEDMQKQIEASELVTLKAELMDKKLAEYVNILVFIFYAFLCSALLCFIALPLACQESMLTTCFAFTYLLAIGCLLWSYAVVFIAAFHFICFDMK